MALRIDFHVHVLPTPPMLENQALEPLRQLKEQARTLLAPVVRGLHGVQPLVRHLPELTRKAVDEIVSTLLPTAGVLLESTPTDLIQAMDASGIDRCILIAQPPLASNEAILDLCQRHSDRLVAAVNPGRERVLKKGGSSILREWHELGARVLKIHAAADGIDPRGDEYREWIDLADELRMPVILHTGCFHSHLAHRSPELSEATRFESWFADWPNVTFVLAHMNFHDPLTAIELAEKHENLLLDTSWQPSETIGEAVRRIGSRRILFGSDWPLLGRNFEVGLERIEDARKSGFLTEEDCERILGGNAEDLLARADSAEEEKEEEREDAAQA